MLLDKGIDFKIKNKEGLDAFDYCSKFNHNKGEADKLKERMFCEFEIKTLDDLIERETKKGNDKIVVELKNLNLEGCLDVDDLIKECISLDKLHLIKLIVLDFNSIYCSARSKFSILENCVKNESVDILDYFFDHGLDINIIDNDGWNLLFFAVKENQKKTITYLIKKGININAISRRKTTPLAIAIKSQWYDIAEMLLDEKADIRISDHGSIVNCCKSNIPTNPEKLIAHENLLKRLDPKTVIDDSEKTICDLKKQNEEFQKLNKNLQRQNDYLQKQNGLKQNDDSKYCVCINHEGKKFKFLNDPLIQMIWDEKLIEPVEYEVHRLEGLVYFKRLEDDKWIDSEFDFPKCDIQRPVELQIKCHVLPAGLYGSEDIFVRFKYFTDY
jgi:ankyrin repeat protein